MKALSELLADRGWTLTGSDLQPSSDITRLNDGQILKVHAGHSAENLPRSVDVVIHSPAIRETNPERIAAQQRGIVELSYVDALGQLMSEQSGIAIAGTHGKTTTTAMVAAILRESGLDPSALVGGEVIQYGRNGWAGTGESLVVEACEYRRHFLSLSPHIAAILNIEPDHFDYFETIDDSRDAFVEFTERLPADGRLILRDDVSRMLSGRVNSDLDVVTFSASNSADWTIRALGSDRGRHCFEVRRQSSPFCEVALDVPGHHNVENALAAVAVAHAAGASSPQIAAALRAFQGVRRRLNVVGTDGQVTLIDDYAHHPTAIRATLATVREMYPDQRRVVVFQPHQISRTEALLGNFATSFADADEVVLVPVFAARENRQGADACLERLGSTIREHGCPVRLLASLDQVPATLHDDARPDDVWITLGAGDIDRIPHEFARHISRNYTG